MQTHCRKQAVGAVPGGISCGVIDQHDGRSIGPCRTGVYSKYERFIPKTQAIRVNDCRFRFSHSFDFLWVAVAAGVCNIAMGPELPKRIVVSERPC